MRHPWLLTGALISAAALLEVRYPACSNELPTHWGVSPGDPVVHMTADWPSSPLFITGRDLGAAGDEDEFFVSARAERGKQAGRRGRSQQRRLRPRKRTS